METYALTLIPTTPTHEHGKEGIDERKRCGLRGIVIVDPATMEKVAMADDARRNAEQLKARLTQELRDLEDKKATISAQLVEVDKFLKALDQYAQLDPSVAKAPPAGVASAAPRKRPQNPPREQVLEVVAEALERAGRPMQLRELFEAVTASGIDLRGTDPSAVLGTMIWRARKRFANVKGYGYWFADRAYEPAGYAPGPAD
jgi:hypothetical protein